MDSPRDIIGAIRRLDFREEEEMDISSRPLCQNFEFNPQVNQPKGPPPTTREHPLTSLEQDASYSMNRPSQRNLWPSTETSPESQKLYQFHLIRSTDQILSRKQPRFDQSSNQLFFSNFGKFKSNSFSCLAPETQQHTGMLSNIQFFSNPFSTRTTSFSSLIPSSETSFSCDTEISSISQQEEEEEEEEQREMNLPPLPSMDDMQFCDSKRERVIQPVRSSSCWDMATLSKYPLSRPNSVPPFLPSPVLPSRFQSLQKSLDHPKQSPSFKNASNSLATICNSRGDPYERISPSTLAELLCSEDSIDFKIVDCRFAYEYSGGHIRGAYHIDQISGLRELYDSHSLATPVLIFHCEFSSWRAPKMYKFLRTYDRKNNIYPNLRFPEIYLLDGGYNRFYTHFPHLCEPNGYIDMDHPRFSEEKKRGMEIYKATFMNKKKNV